jgi:hypothetical protein
MSIGCRNGEKKGERMFMSFQRKLVSHTLKENEKGEKKREKKRSEGWFPERKEIDW